MAHRDRVPRLEPPLDPRPNEGERERGSFVRFRTFLFSGSERPASTRVITVARVRPTPLGHTPRGPPRAKQETRAAPGPSSNGPGALRTPPVYLMSTTALAITMPA